MKVQFRESFLRDIEALGNRASKKRLRETIEQAEHAAALHHIRNVKKLKGGDPYHRIRVGDYRLGLMVHKGTVVFVRCLHRKGIYRYFKRS